MSLLSVTGSVLGQSVELEPMIVTADPLTEQVDEANGLLLAGNAVVLDRELLEKTTENSLSDLLQTRAGISFDSFFGNSALAAPQLRGFGENGQLRTLVTVDGLPINRSDLALTPWSRTPLSNLQKVTVLRGGRSVRYGSGALAGVIALETKRSEEAFSGSFEGTAGSDETSRQRLYLGGQSKGWGWTVQGEHFDSDGYRENSSLETSSASISILTPESEWGENRLTLSASRAQFEDPGALSLDAFREDPRQSLQPDQVLESKTVTLGDQLKVNLGSEWSLEFKVAGSATNRNADYQGQISDGDSRSLDGDIVLSRQGDEWSFETGARYRYSDLDFDRTQPFGSGTDQQFAELSRVTYGGFVTARWEATDALTISAGASWDSYRLDGEARSPNAPTNPRRNFSGDAKDGDYALEFGFEYQLTERSRVWGRYDRSLRFPVLDEVAFFQGFESEIPFNTDLRPERGQGVEFGIIIEDEDAGWKASSNVFGQWLEDEIFFDAIANINENLDETERLGIETELSWENDRWGASFFYAATLARFRSGVDEDQRVPLVPRHTLSGTLTLHLTEAIDLGLEASYVSNRLDGNDRGELGQAIQFREVPGRTLWNVTASWAVNDSFTVFGRINNVFDEQYISTQFSDGIYPGVGRQALFGGRIQF